MEFDQLIKRINELSRKSKTEGLTPEEKAEYDASKAAYEKAKAEYIGKNQAASITL